MDPSSPLRNDGVTIACAQCGQPIMPSGRRRFCSAACRQALWRQRHAIPPAPLPSRTPKSLTVYACPLCDARFLGEQRCPDCQVFCRRVGPGGSCPHCDEPVALVDLIPTP